MFKSVIFAVYGFLMGDSYFATGDVFLRGTVYPSSDSLVGGVEQGAGLRGLMATTFYEINSKHAVLAYPVFLRNVFKAAFILCRWFFAGDSMMT
jgi:hypothetical protein